MKGCLALLSCVLLAATAAATGGDTPSSTDPDSLPRGAALSADTPVMRVDGREVAKIWYDRVLVEMTQGLSQAAGAHGVSNDQVRRLALGRLLEQELLYTLSLRHEVPGLEEEVDRRFHAFVAGVGGTEEFEKGLRTQGLEARHLKYILRREVATAWYVENVVGRQVAVTEAEVRSLYEEKKGHDYDHPEKRKIYQILSAGSRGEEEARRRLAEVRARFMAGEGFGPLALEYSDDPLSRLNDGLMGYRVASELPEEVAAACFAVKPGEISEIARSPYGYHVFLVTEVVPAQSRSFEDVREEAFRRARDVKLKKALDATLKRAGKEVKVEILMHR
jgi:hypothetical protein